MPAEGDNELGAARSGGRPPLPAERDPATIHGPVPRRASVLTDAARPPAVGAQVPNPVDAA